MGQLLVRNVDIQVISRLKARAARNGRSVEAEHRALLSASLVEEPLGPTFKEFLFAMPDVGDDDDFARSEDGPRAIDD